MKAARTLFLVLILMGCSTSSVDRSEKAGFHLRMGTSYLMAGNYPSALRELLESVQLDPGNPVTHHNLALAYLVRERFELAEKHTRRALELNPRYTAARNTLGRVLIEQKLYDSAIGELKLATQDLTYDSPDQTYSNLGLAYLRKGHYQPAEESLKRSLRVRRESCETLNFYGIALFELKKYSEAAASFDQAIRVCDQNRSAREEPFYYSGLSYWRIGDRDRSLAKLHEVIELFPASEYAGKARNIIEIINRTRQ